MSLLFRLLKFLIGHKVDSRISQGAFVSVHVHSFCLKLMVASSDVATEVILIFFYNTQFLWVKKMSSVSVLKVCTCLLFALTVIFIFNYGAIWAFPKISILAIEICIFCSYSKSIHPPLINQTSICALGELFEHEFAEMGCFFFR